MKERAEIEQSGKPITITRGGRTVAVLGPAKRGGQKSPCNSWSRKGKILGDIVTQDTSVVWDVV